MIEAWRPLTANATAWGLVMLVVYITAASLCASAASKCRIHPRYRGGGARIGMMRRERLLWQAMAALLAILAVYRQFDIAELLTELGRIIAVQGNWYRHRHPYQEAIISVIAIVVLVIAAAIYRVVSTVNPLALTAFASCTVLVLLLGINVLSLHWMDAFFHKGYHRVNVYNLTETGSLATIMAAASFYREQVAAVYRRRLP